MNTKGFTLRNGATLDIFEYRIKSARRFRGVDLAYKRYILVVWKDRFELFFSSGKDVINTVHGFVDYLNVFHSTSDARRQSDGFTRVVLFHSRECAFQDG